MVLRLLLVLAVFAGAPSCRGLAERAPKPALGLAAASCPVEGAWFDPPRREVVATPELYERLAGKRVILLGERHDRPEEHRWQLHTIAALLALRPRLALGFEMFPRSSQPALDAWYDGALDEKGLLEASRWSDVWGHPPDLYLPILHAGRMHRCPMVGLNVDRDLIARVSAEGWDAIPEDDRAGIGDPAAPPPEYREALLAAFQEHVARGVAPTESDPDLFVEAQLVWDRAFAQGIRDALLRFPGAPVVALIGRGHVEHGHGVPDQLEALGIDDYAVLLPWDLARDCSTLTDDLADAVFAVRREPPAEDRPRLGVFIAGVPGGVAVRDVAPDSVAARAGLAAEDVIVAAAGVAVTKPGELQRIVARQAPGTWLPLTVERAGERIEMVARFPPER